MRRLHAVKFTSMDDKSYNVVQAHAVWVLSMVLQGPQDLCFYHQTFGIALQYSLQLKLVTSQSLPELYKGTISRNGCPVVVSWCS